MTHPTDYGDEQHPQHAETRARRRVVAELRALRAWVDRAIALLDDHDPAPVPHVPRTLIDVATGEALHSRYVIEWVAVDRALGHWRQVLRDATATLRRQVAEDELRTIAPGLLPTGDQTIAHPLVGPTDE